MRGGSKGVGTSQPKDEYVFMLDTGTWRHASSVTPTPTVTPAHTPTPTPSHTPTPTPTHTPVTTPSHALASTPQITPDTTPVTSPQRLSGAISKKPKQQLGEADPGIFLMIRSDVTLPETMTYQQIKKEIKKEKIIKYVYTNIAFNQETVKKFIETGKYDLTKIKRVPIVLEHFKQIKSGGAYKYDSIVKIERRNQ